MQILNVTLHNVKSYGEGPEVKFHPGINFISGRNGSGKTTLLEAIGYAIFDHNNYSKASSMLRNGAKKGKIEVTFTLDGVTAHIISRAILSRGTGSWIVKEKDAELEIASGEEAVKSWIRKNLGIEEGMDLAQMYSQIIGVPQGEITTYYKGTDKERQRHFDPLMGTQSYLKSFENTAHVEGALQIELSAIKERVAALDERCRGYEGESAQLRELTAAVLELSARHKEKSDEKTMLNSELEQLELFKAELSLIEIKIGNLETEAIGKNSRKLSLEADMKESKNAGKILEENEVSRNIYLLKTEQIKSLESQLVGKKAKDDEMKRLSSLTANKEGEIRVQKQNHETKHGELIEEAAHLKGELDQSTDELVKLASEDTTLKSLEDGQEKLSGALDELKKSHLTIQQSERDLIRLQEDLKKKDEKKSVLQAAAENAPDLTAIQAELEGLEGEIIAKGSLVSSLKIKIEEFKALQGTDGRCPVTGQPCAEIDPVALKQMIAEAKENIQAIETETKKLKTTKREFEKRRKDAEKAEAKLESIIEVDDEISDIQEKIVELCAAHDIDAVLLAIEEWGTAAMKLTLDVAIPAFESGTLQNYLEIILPEFERVCGNSEGNLIKSRNDLSVRVGAQKEVHNRLIGDVKKNKNEVKLNEMAQKELKIQEKELEANLSSIGRLGAELAELVLVETELSNARELQEKNAEAYRIYETHRMLANNWETLKNEMDSIVKRLAAIHDEITTAQLRRTEIAATYSEEVLKEKNELMFKLAATLGSMETDLKTKATRKLELETKLLGLEKDMVTLRESKEEAALLVSISQASRSIRDALKEAGPLVAARYREVISDIANSIFRSINEERAELKWQEDYLITLHDQRGEREFNQLSGGEQMTAALAVQLALAKEFSALGVAMFDEPTTNMDKERRGELAKIIGRIKETYGFEQLFVISHDEAFETMTEQVIRLEKENGTTKLAVEM